MIGIEDVTFVLLSLQTEEFRVDRPGQLGVVVHAFSHRTWKTSPQISEFETTLGSRSSTARATKRHALNAYNIYIHTCINNVYLYIDLEL